ncbi:DNA-damage-inducible protein F [Thalassovita gelatinovora]|uniref:DNA-damage-inducible protein F n=1 Tax=Thalassovita gelatinovora TaxID=53501 RepID=A0A0P1FX52_THAGE|nr:MATE family efflux transporter [Thalassovita gelatinovora]QIZ80163.1 MATE family efflux transporter [Thalassovita gelatinovora]CUH63966.1 DNA-damage-inducible protein F [Thalassovita gelatinovora]SEQ80789.1 multidrug resistance protein, MATE family [Thalassovita gelatinovora]
MAAAPVTHRRVLKIALPVVLSNATVPLLGAVDTGVVGQMGLAAPIAAVGVGAIMLTAIYWMFGFLRMGTTGLVSQAHGAGQTGEVAALLTRALLIAGGAGMAIILLQMPIFSVAFWVSPATPEVESLARDYMQIRVFSAPAAISIYGLTGWLIAQERTRGMFLIQFWMNGLNIVLDLWFVLGLGWGVTGVAWATFLSEWSAVALGLWLCRDAFAVPAWRDWPRVFDRERLRHMMALNSNILIRSLLLQVVFVSFLLLGARFGDVTLAANQVLLQFLYITSYGMDGFAFAAEALVGQYMGARDGRNLRRAALLTGGWAIVIVLAMALLFAVFGGMIIDIMTTSDAVRSEARIYLIYMVLAPLAGVAAWMFDGIFIGATGGRDMRNMMVVSFGIYLVALVALLPMFGNHGLWMALLISFIARGVTLALRYPGLERRAGIR